MIIFSPISSNRLSYTLNVLYKGILKTDYKLITSIEGIDSSAEKIINYSSQEIKAAFQVVPNGLLFENTIGKQAIVTGECEGLPTLFHTGQGDIPFDVFSAVFYMLSRYEEYLPFEGDSHGRFKAEESIAFKNGFHKLPVVELWCKLLAERTGIPFPADSCKQKLTIDIDNASKHKNKGFIRTCGSILKLVSTGNWQEIAEKIRVLRGIQNDPADTFEYLENIEKKLSSPIQYFVLAGTKGRNDRAISIKNKEYSQLLQKLNLRNRLGLHPSYLAFSAQKELEKEYLALCAVVSNKIIRSRQHFLLLKFPDTYRALIKLGIREEYSMGWSSHTGFRAGISMPFPFFDLPANKETHLMLVPFAAMDRTLKDHLNLTPEKALNELKQLCDTIKSVGGTFAMLWHNDSINDAGEWKGWKTVFELALEYSEPEI